MFVTINMYPYVLGSLTIFSALQVAQFPALDLATEPAHPSTINSPTCTNVLLKNSGRMKPNDQPNPHVPESEMILNPIKTISRRKQSLFGDEFHKEMNHVLKEEQSQRINVGSNRQST